jgi:hypothetical protein
MKVKKGEYDTPQSWLSWANHLFLRRRFSCGVIFDI